MAENNVIKFRQTSFELEQAGDRFMADENYPDAADCYYRALQKDKKNDGLMVKLARLYFEVGDNILSSEWYIRALHQNPDNEFVYPGLVHNYADMGLEMRDVVYHYFTLGRRRGIVSDEELEDVADIEEMDERRQDLELEAKHRPHLVLHRGGSDEDNKYDIDETDVASGNPMLGALLSDMPKSNPNYYILRRTLMKVAVIAEDFEASVKIAEELIEHDESDDVARLYGARAYHELKNYKRRDELFAGIDLDSDFSLDEMEEAATVAWRQGDYEKAYSFLREIMRDETWDRSIMLKTALCMANLGMIEQARTLAVQALRLYPDDIALAYYANAISELKEKSNFEPLETVPTSEAERREDELDKWLAEKGTLTAVYEGLKHDETMRENLDWLFQEGDDSMQLSVAKFLAQGKRFKTYLEQLLILPSVSSELKHAIISEMLSAEIPCSFSVTTGHLYRRVTYNPREYLSDRALNVYRRAFAILLFRKDSFEQELNLVFSVACDRIDSMTEKREDIDFDAVAAAICKVSKLIREEVPLHMYADAFGCNVKKLGRYLANEGIDLNNIPIIENEDDEE